jgi:hypothetical protein
MKLNEDMVTVTFLAGCFARGKVVELSFKKNKSDTLQRIKLTDGDSYYIPRWLMDGMNSRYNLHPDKYPESAYPFFLNDVKQ